MKKLKYSVIAFARNSGADRVGIDCTGVEEEEMNTWPDGYPHAISQSDHELWNANNYPGTRQLCEECESPTGRCEEDSLYEGEDNEIGPLCEDCYSQYKNMTASEKAARITALMAPYLAK